MDILTQNVVTATELEPRIVKPALGHVLLFLRDKVPSGHVGELIDKNKDAREAVNAAEAASDSGVTAFIEGMTSFIGHGRADLNILVGKLMNLGLTEAQIKTLFDQFLARADVLLGPDGVVKVRDIVTHMDERKPLRNVA